MSVYLLHSQKHMMHFFFVFLFSIASRANEIVLTQGDLLPISNPSIIETKGLFKSKPTANGSFRLMALKPGVTRLKSNNQWYTVQIVTPSQKMTYQKIESVLPKTIGLKIKFEEGMPTIFGQLFSFNHWLLIARSCESVCLYRMKAKISSGLSDKVQNQFDQIFNDHGLTKQSINLQNPSLLLLPKGTEKNSSYSALLKPYGIQAKENNFAIENRPMIQVSVTLAEVKKESFLKYGIEWPSSYEVNAIRPLVETEELLVNIMALESNGDGKILAQPKLIAKSGQSADFFAGGEFPIKLISGKNSSVIWKSYGLRIEVKPTTDHTGLVSIELLAEMSSLDTSKSVDGVPALFNHKVRSKFDVQNGNTISLSGLVRSEDGRNLAGLPGIGQLPVLGGLFSSRDYRNSRSELVVLVKPEIMNLSPRR